MDLKALLEANKSKIGKSQPTRRPVDIADQDRPYSIAEIPNISNIENRNEAIKKQTQTQHKHDTEHNTKTTQTQHKDDTEKTQTQHKDDTEHNTQKTQRRHKLNTNSTRNATQTQHISSLVGIQKRLLLFIFETCKRNRSQTTELLSKQHIADLLKIRVGSITTSCERLIEKGFLFKDNSKEGRGGLVAYGLPNEIYKELLQIETNHKLDTNSTQFKHKIDTQRDTEHNTNTSSSSSNLINKTTTDLNNEWNFDITPYHRFGFTGLQLKQLASLGVISAAQVEQSLMEFSYDLDNNALPIIKTGKINFLMGLFRSGNMYVSEGYKNEQEAIISEMARRAEVKRKKLLEEKFRAWEGVLSDEERKRILIKLPTSLMVLEKTYGISNQEVKNWYFDYFMQSVKG